MEETTTAICPTCGKPFGPEQKFCTGCGTPRSAAQKKFCPECGAALKPGQAFCAGCGRRTASGEAPQMRRPAELKYGLGASPRKAGRRTGAIIGIAAGAAVLLAIVLAVIFLIPSGPESIAITPDSCTLEPSDTIRLGYSIVESRHRDVDITWTSSDEYVAVVNDGLVTANHPGTAVIEVQTANGKTAQCTVTVEMKAEDRFMTGTWSMTELLHLDTGERIDGSLSPDTRLYLYDDRSGLLYLDPENQIPFSWGYEYTDSDGDDVYLTDGILWFIYMHDYDEMWLYVDRSDGETDCLTMVR